MIIHRRGGPNDDNEAVNFSKRDCCNPDRQPLVLNFNQQYDLLTSEGYIVASHKWYTSNMKMKRDYRNAKRNHDYSLYIKKEILRKLKFSAF